ncbi:MAG: hypothetical protein AB8H86_15895 [Polyangiales bacterium]
MDDKWVEANLSRVHAIKRGLILILQESWPEESVIYRLEQDHESHDACHLLRAVCVELNARYPTLRLFWKDENLRWLGGCARFAQDAGGTDAADLIGLSDDSPGVPFQRQAAKYHRDDRKVMKIGHAYNIVERQDRDENVVAWLRTSKVAIHDGERVCGLVGGYDEVDVATVRRIQSNPPNKR